jgi:hypothetical protein
LTLKESFSGGCDVGGAILWAMERAILTPKPGTRARLCPHLSPSSCLPTALVSSFGL